VALTPLLAALEESVTAAAEDASLDSDAIGCAP